jgi:hypothetical protein
MVGLLVTVLGVLSYFHLSSDTRAVRREITRASGVEWRQQIGLNIGSLTMSAARAGLAFVPLEPEARAALRSVRGVEVGVYEQAAGLEQADREAMLAVADRVLNARGWERVVGVLEGKSMVGVYLPAKVTPASRMKACVVVQEGRQMVVVSAQANLEPLLECLRNNPEWRAGMRSLACR